MGTRRQLRRTDLFLVRVWREYSKPEGELEGTGSSAVPEVQPTGGEWHGQVRRVANGESRQFDGLVALLDVLTDMLGGSGADGTNQE
jgi:hypothetical protein